MLDHHPPPLFDWLRRLPVRTPTLPPATHTNVYVVGEGDLAVVDPASPWTDEQRALDAFLDALPGRVVEILLTHHHLDHVSGAAHLSARLGVRVAAHHRTASLVADRVKVTRILAEGDRLPYGPKGLRVLETPGHAPGHLVFLDEHSGALIAGDMVASIGTIIIDPPEGDMALYLASLRRLRALGATQLLPAHGDPVTAPEAHLDHYIAHRLDREARVLDAVRRHAPATPLALVPHAYPDLGLLLYPLAARSLLAHLLKLEAEGQAVRHPDDTWSAVG